MKMKDLSLYIHIPFCVRKCDYCDFLSAPADEMTKEAYVQALLLEIQSHASEETADSKVKTIFIGGGTPTTLSAEQTASILDKIRTVFLLKEDCEISMEMNPGSVTKEKCTSYFKEGVNRLSIGLQSPDDVLLKRLGRIHTYDDFLRTYDMVRDTGFRNVNVDLMSALPGQSVAAYCEGLAKVSALSPEHISAYSLIVEEGTPFYEKYNSECNLKKEEELPDELQDREMYECTKEILGRNGYGRYEISNYAKKGFACKHNIVYWKRGEYLGLGLGSSSLINNARFKNTSNLKEYIHAWKNGTGERVRCLEREVLSVRAQMEEFMFLGLRMMQGVSEKQFESMFGRTMEEVYGRQIDDMLKQDLLCIVPEPVGTDGGMRVALTEKGIDVSNYVFAQFLF